MQIAGDVRRRDDDAKRLRRRPVGAAGPEGARFLPKRGGAAFGRGEVERFVHHGILVRAIPAGAAVQDRLGTIRAALAAACAEKRKRQERAINASPVEVNARRTARAAYLPSARDPLNFLPHQPLDNGWEVVVQPLLEHRPQASRAPCSSASSALRTSRLADKAPNDNAAASARLGRQQRLLACAQACPAAGSASTVAAGARRPSARSRPGAGTSPGRRRAARRRPWNRRFAAWAREPAAALWRRPLGGVPFVGDDVADRGEDLLHRGLVGPLRPLDRLKIAVAGIRIDRAHQTALPNLRGLVLCAWREASNSTGARADRRIERRPLAR